MNLLEELTKNSFRSDFLFLALSEDPPSLLKPSQQSLPLQNNSSSHESHQKCKIQATSIADFFSKETKGLSEVDRRQNTDYFLKYREKVTKINAMVSLLSAKNRKIKYQFMVNLERWVKLNSKVGDCRPTNKDANKQSNRICQSSCQKQNQISLTFEHLSQTFTLLKKKVEEIFRTVFARMKKKVKLGLKMEVFSSVLQTTKIKIQMNQSQQVFRLIKNIPMTKTVSKVLIKPATSLTIPLRLKALNIKNPADSCSLPLACFSQVENMNSKLLFQRPQNSLQENIDYCDTLALFMGEDPRSEDRSISQFDLSFSNNNVYPSVCDGEKETLSQKTYIKQLSDVELTREPTSAFAKRKISDFTISNSENRAVDNFSQAAGKKQNQSGLNLIRSEVNLHNTIDDDHSLPLQRCFQYKEREFLSPRTEDFQTFYPIQIEPSAPKRYSFQKQIIARSGSEAKVSHRHRFSVQKIEIDREYEEEMGKYQTFKKYLMKRRENTLQEMQKNQQILKKLMQKFENSKKKAEKLKITLKSKGQKQKLAVSLLKKSSKNPKLSTPSKSPVRETYSKSSLKKQAGSGSKRVEKKQKCGFHSSLQKGEPKELKFDLFPKNANVYYSYIKEKNIMNSSKGTPTKKCPSPKRELCTSAKKPSKNNVSSAAQKNLLAISKFPCGKDQRLNLRVDFPKDQSKKGGNAQQSKNKKISKLKISEC